MWNSDFEALFPKLDNKTMANLEKQLLLLLGYHVTMKSSELRVFGCCLVVGHLPLSLLVTRARFPLSRYADYFFRLKGLSPSAFDVEEPLSDAGTAAGALLRLRKSPLAPRLAEIQRLESRSAKAEQQARDVKPFSKRRASGATHDAVTRA